MHKTSIKLFVKINKKYSVPRQKELLGTYGDEGLKR